MQTCIRGESTERLSGKLRISAFDACSALVYPLLTLVTYLARLPSSYVITFRILFLHLKSSDPKYGGA